MSNSKARIISDILDENGQIKAEALAITGESGAIDLASLPNIPDNKIESASDWNSAYGWGDHAQAGYQDAATAITTSNIAAQTVANADTLTTPRNIALSGDVSGSVSFDGSANVSITATVADDSHNHVIANVDGLQDALNDKVDVELGKGLSTEDYTTAEKSKLAGIESGAEVNTVTSVAGKTGIVTLDKTDVGLANVDNTSDLNKPVSTATQTALNAKVAIADIINNLTSNNTDKPLSANQGLVLKNAIDNINAILASDDTTLDELQEIVDYIKQNRSDLDALGISNIAGLQAALDTKVDKITGKGLSTEDYTTAEKSKLAGIAAGANNYSHPTYAGDDINLDTGPLTGATVISDLDFNVTTDTLGHVTDANATYSTRNLTAADVGAAAASHTHTIANVTGLQSALDGKVNTANLTYVGAGSDIDSIGVSGFYRIGTGILNGPSWTDFSYGQLIVSEGADTIAQILVDFNSSEMAFRGGNPPAAGGAGTYVPWARIWNDRNDGSGSGLDADLLDGQHASAFAATSHTHTIANVTGLQSALDGKLSTSGKAADANLLDGIDSTGFLRSDAVSTLSSVLKVGTSGNIVYADTAGTYIPRPAGGSYKTTTPSVTGALTIRLPGAIPSDMVSFWVDVMDYDGNPEGESVSIYVYGYAYSTGSPYWTNVGALILSDRTDKDYNVRFGYDGTNHVVCIGEVGSTWNYPQVVVRDFQAGYNATEDTFDLGWSVTFLTTLPAIGPIAENNYPVAKRFEIARTISLAGDVTGSTTFDGSGNVSITATVADDSHNHVISNVDGLQAALDGKAATSHTHDDRYYTETESDARFSNIPISNDSFTGTYPMVWEASGTLYSSSFVTINGATDTLSAPAFSGSGAALTSLNASNLSSGTVPSGRLSGSYSISITGNAATATTASNSNALGGLSVHTGRNNEANKVVRTDGDGYIQAGWINTTSGDRGTTAPTRIYASNDEYLRYYTPANFRQVLSLPTRTGGDASGTWGINITGNAATSSSSPILSSSGNYVWSASSLPTTFPLGIQCSFVQGSNGFPNFGSLMNMRTYSGGGGSLQLYVPYGPSNGGTGLQVRFGDYNVSSGNSWTAWKTLLASDNYNSYSPTLTGGGASGTWGINITGNASGNAATVTNGVYTTGTQTIGGSKTFSSTINTSSGNGGGVRIGGGPNITSVSPSSSSGDLVLQGCTQLRVGNTNYDWNAWAGWAWAGSTNPIYFGGPASSAFSSNASPPVPPLIFTGVSYSESEGSLRAPIFYDSNNTGYYVDPASTSNLNSLTLAGKTTVGTFPNSTTNTGEAWFGRAADRNIGTYTLQLGGNSTSGRSFEVVDYAWSSVMFQVNSANYAQAAGSMRAPIFYDSNDTGFYADPNGTSRFVRLILNNGDNLSWGAGYGAGVPTISAVTNTGLYFYPRGSTSGGTFQILGDHTVATNQMRAPIFYDSNDTAYYCDPTSTSYFDAIGRRAHHRGHLVGSYNNIGDNSGKSNPIYTIGSSYNPNDASLGNMYGVGYSHSNFFGTSLTGTDWGFYVAAGGAIRVILNANNGNIGCTGNVTAYASDERLKTNISVIKDPLNKLKKISGVTYDWIDECEDLGFIPTHKHEHGVIAQHIQEVIPDAVKTAPFNDIATERTGEDRNYLTVDKEKIIPLLIEAIKEQQTQIEALTSEINTLKEKIK